MYVSFMPNIVCNTFRLQQDKKHENDYIQSNLHREKIVAEIHYLPRSKNMHKVWHGWRDYQEQSFQSGGGTVIPIWWYDRC